MTTIQAPTKTSWAWAIATFFGIGFLPGGPGTWASLATAAIWYFAARAAHEGSAQLVISTVIAALVVTLIGIPAASAVERESGIKDPGFIVIDEVAGQLVALILLPAQLRYAIPAFVLFRLFDILKPPPVRQFERLPGGAGIMVDDVAAGVYALIVGALVVFIMHLWR